MGGTQPAGENAGCLGETIFNNAQVMMIVTDRSGSIRCWNRAAEHVTGYTKEEVTGSAVIWKTIYPEREYRRDVTGRIRKILSRRDYFENFETTIRTKDRGERIISWNAKETEDSGDVQIITVGIDVTERRLAEKQIEESSRFLAILMDTLPVPVFYKDLSGKYLGFNRAFEEYLGKKREDMIGRTAYDLAPKDLADRYTAADREILNNPAPVRYETSVQFSDGSRHDVIFYKAPFYRGDGSVAGLIGTYIDITERKRMEEGLIAANREYHNLLDQIQDVYYRSDPEGTLVQASRSWATLLGYDDIADCLGKNIAAAFYMNPSDRKAFLDAVEKNGSVTGYEILLKKKDGTPVLIATSSHKYYAADGTPIGVEGTFRDITEQRKAERALVAYISEMAMRLKNPVEILRDNLADLAQMARGGTLTFEEIAIALDGQARSVGQVARNVAEFQKAIAEKDETIPEAYRNFLSR